MSTFAVFVITLSISSDIETLLETIGEKGIKETLVVFHKSKRNKS